MFENSFVQKHLFWVNRKGVIFHLKFACPLTQLNWIKISLRTSVGENCFSPPFSFDLASYDYQLFRGLQNHLDSLRGTSRKEVEHELVSYLASKPKGFYKPTIYNLADRRGEVLRSNTVHVKDKILLQA